MPTSGGQPLSSSFHDADDSAILEITGQPSGRIDLDESSEPVLRMCHDLVTPALTIRRLAELIETEPDLPAEIRRRAELIAAEADRISEICAFALESSRARGSLRLEAVVSECVSSARAWFRGTLEERTTPVTVSAHRVPILRLVSNLLHNACQAAGPHGTVSVSLDHSEQCAVLEIVNSGPPLDPALWWGGSRPGDTPRPDSLGLRIVAGILEDHGGWLDIQSQPLDGTAVRAVLPLKAPGDNQRPTPQR